MLRIFQTGDNHIGLKYAGYAQGPKLAERRIEALRELVRRANELECDLFAVAGDLFHSRRGIGRQAAAQAAEILAEFEEQVLVLPGNHDYYSPRGGGEAKNVWDYFQEAAGDNTLLLTEYRPYELTVRDERVIVYPAPCRTKHSQPGENHLGWIREEAIRPDAAYRVGMAHGAVEGQTIDSEGCYFLMSRKELESIPVDVWLIGHTHVPFPELGTDAFREGGRIFNAGTHLQTDAACRAEGGGFLLELNSGSGQKRVRARRVPAGGLRFHRKTLSVRPGEALSALLERELREIPDESVVDLILTGAVSEEDYQNRRRIVDGALARFLDRGLTDDSALSPLLTEERIKREYAETSFTARLLLRLLDQPKEAQMVYDLLRECR